MGVPAFYRWLAEKYPKIVQDVLEKRNKVVDGNEIPLNLLDDNPNGQEFDNLYVDMNGLIHPCSHPEDREAPTTEAEMYVNVTKYVDRLFAAVRPRRLLFLAIDGVAPRAKMNQQRARRFRAAQEAAERQEALNEVLEEMNSLGLDSPFKEGSAWDSNVITPGTEFMDRLSVYLRFYILDRMNRDASWRNVKVVLSDASEPGEGEHKIMNFIRRERAQPGYDPNQRHVLHGLDADLIMLGLSTHEVHFTILREEVTFGRKKHEAPMSDAKKMLHDESIGISSLRPEDEWVYSKSLQFVHIKILREYLAFEFSSLEEKLPFGYDLERTIDDFVFICFFVGNDFLPHMPSLDIRDGAIDFLMQAYKEMLPSMGGYLTSPGGTVNLRQVRF
jgi:5'-3' exoribonuclease 2